MFELKTGQEVWRFQNGFQHRCVGAEPLAIDDDNSALAAAAKGLNEAAWRSKPRAYDALDADSSSVP
jgi:hypothetical protein